MVKFDFDKTPNKLTMICYFWKNFKPSIKVEMDHKDQKVVNFKEMVQKVNNTKAKASLKSNTIIRDLNIYYSRSYRLSNNFAAKVQIQEIIIKEPHSKKAKTKDTNQLYFIPIWQNLWSKRKKTRKKKEKVLIKKIVKKNLSN